MMCPGHDISRPMLRLGYKTTQFIVGRSRVIILSYIKGCLVRCNVSLIVHYDNVTLKFLVFLFYFFNITII